MAISHKSPEGVRVLACPLLAKRISLLLFVAGFGLAVEAQRGSTVRTAGNMTVGRAGDTATLLQDGRVLIVGGLDEATAEIYDPSTRRFSPTASMRARRWLHTATLLPDGKVLIAGGRSSIPPEVLTAPTELYDPVTRAFSRAGNHASPGTLDRSGGPLWPRANLLPDGRVLIIGDNPADLTIPKLAPSA
ncbi:MAG: hypothetical protein NDJ92_09705 [Thermoanaerobaculia bacterium]|nr:hypothetical protein [Thermoanaerobaculia bacterium]